MSKTQRPEIRHANSVTVAVCEHGSLHLNLCGADGKVFASACMDRDTSFIMIDQIMSEFSAPSSNCDGVH
jgi:hypothetical protein